MNRRQVAWSGLGAVALGAVGSGAWLLSLPPAPAVRDARPIPQEEIEATLAALKPPKRQRPLIAIVGINDATEVTDYLMPYGILRRAGVADVVALATEPGPVTLYPALAVEPQATIAEFDARHPDGADYVIVPAMSRDDDPAVLAWLQEPGGQARDHRRRVRRSEGRRRSRAARRQASDDPLVLPEELRAAHPTIHYVADRRLDSRSRAWPRRRGSARRCRWPSP